LSDHASLTIVIPIVEEHINSRKCSIIKDSKEESTFIKDLTTSIRNINIFNMSDITSLDRAVNKFAIENAWEKNLKIINITKYSKSWWDESCSRNLECQDRRKCYDSMLKVFKQRTNSCIE